MKLAQPFGDAGQCLRCRGLTVVEDLCGDTASAPGWELTVRRCVICGDVVDPVILEHRAFPVVRLSGYQMVRNAGEDTGDSLDQEEEGGGRR